LGKLSFMKLPSRPTWKWILIICLFIALCLFFVYRYNSQVWAQGVRFCNLLQDHRRLKGFILSFGAYSPLAYILLQVVQVVIAPIPGGAIEFLGGYLFGTNAGFVYSMVGLFFGSWLAFSLARAFEKRTVERFVSAETRKKFDYLIEHEGVILSFLLFLIPGFPKDTLCYILGLTPMHLGDRKSVV
jgi:uncharacterized membrane protein YdjX (TVP38/TMEM64 family)